MFLCLLLASTDAIIVTHNGGAGLDRPDLRYADDDGLQYAQLFRQAGVRVTLLTQLDNESQLLHKDPAVDGVPTREELFAAVKRSSADEIYLIFAGHGDVREGQGFLNLADGPLTSADLDTQVLAPLDTKRVHLLIDACNSYFMITPRKPGGTPFKVKSPEPLLARHPNVNVLLSTNAEAVTYEWSELQSGIFSYVVRSALRGAADADNDGAISYAEAAAFVRVATQSIENDAYRPHVFTRSTASLFTLPKNPGNELTIEGAHRLTLRTQKGIRIADVNTEATTRLWLPEDKVTIEERVGNRIVSREMGPLQRVALASLPETTPQFAGRGESPVFNALFARPFGKTALAQAATQPVEADFGVSRAEVDRLRLILRDRASAERASRTASAWMVGALSAGLVGASIPSFVAGGVAHRTADIVNGVFFAGHGVALAAIALPLIIVRPTTSERLLLELDSAPLATEQGRTATVVRIREHFFRLHNSARRAQILQGSLAIGAAAGLAAAAAAQTVSAVHANEPIGAWASPMSNLASYAGVSLGVAVYGIYQLVTLPKKLRSIEEVELEPQPATPRTGVSFDGAALRF